MVSAGRNEDLVWVKTGRYTFEVKTVELHSPAEPQNSNCNLQSLVHTRISMSLFESLSDKSLVSVSLARKAVNVAVEMQQRNMNHTNQETLPGQMSGQVFVLPVE